jgi:hypothetical protein
MVFFLRLPLLAIKIPSAALASILVSPVGLLSWIKVFLLIGFLSFVGYHSML